MLAAILRNQNHSVSTILSSATCILSVVGTGETGFPSGLLTGAALGSLAAQQLIGSLKPVLIAGQVEKFEATWDSKYRSVGNCGAGIGSR